MVEGYPYGLGGWGVPGIFKEAGRLFGRYFSLLCPFIFAFLLPTAVIQLLEVLGLSWWTTGQSPFIPPGPHPHGFSKVSAGIDGYPPLPPTPSGSAILIMVAVGILMWLLASLAVASVCKAVEYIYSEHEEDPSVIKSIFSSLPGALYRLFVTSIWVFLLTLATMVTIWVPFYLLSLFFKEKHAPIFAILQQVFLSVALTILGFLFLLSQEVAVLEPANYGLAALKKSSKLVQEKFLSSLTLFALSILVGGLLSKLSDYITASFSAPGKLPYWSLYIFAVLFAILYLAFMVYILLVTVVLYFSSKLRYDAEEGSLPEFRHSSHDNPYTPLVVPAEN